MDWFWHFLWYTIVIFAFVAYLIVLWHIVADLFRRHDTSGWAKALWALGLIVFPYLTAIVYLLINSRGMSERSRRAQAEAQQAVDNYIRTVSGATPAQQIAEAKVLLDSGAISTQEYEQLKARALG